MCRWFSYWCIFCIIHEVCMCVVCFAWLCKTSHLQNSHRRPKGLRASTTSRHWMQNVACMRIHLLHKSPATCFEYFSKWPPSFVCTRTCSGLRCALRVLKTNEGDDGGGRAVEKPLSRSLSSSCIFPPPSAIDYVAHYKSTASWATLQVP